MHEWAGKVFLLISFGKLITNFFQANFEYIQKVRKVLLKMHLRIFGHLFQLSKIQQHDSQSLTVTANEFSKNLLGLYEKGRHISILVVCSDNSSSSFIGSAMGNAVAAYHSLEKIRFYSGGITSSRLNQDAIKVLEDIGFEIWESGEHAECSKVENNPCFFVHWGKKETDGMLEFSKKINDLKNPNFRENFLGLMLCDKNESGSDDFSLEGSKGTIYLVLENQAINKAASIPLGDLVQLRDYLGSFMLATLGLVRDELDKAFK